MMRSRKRINDSFSTFGENSVEHNQKLLLEVLLDIKEQLDEIKEYLKHRK